MINQIDMKFTIKIYNPDIIDCSSCPNAIYPNPDSIELLLDILLKVCESDVVAKIGTFNFLINSDEVKLYCPPVCGTADRSGEIDIICSRKQDEENKISCLFQEGSSDRLLPETRMSRHKQSHNFHL